MTDNSQIIDIPLFKTANSFNIDITALAKAARDNIESVQIIHIPSVVRKQKRRGDHAENPTLSELGGGVDHDFCQIVAGVDGRPVNIDNVVFVSNDPAKAGINHGTAAVENGSFFGVGWKRLTDKVILLYRIVSIGVYTLSKEELLRTKNRDNQNNVAKLTCELAGYSMTTWNGSFSTIPDHLVALHETTEKRMITSYPAPLYMEYIRMSSATEESNALAQAMINNQFGSVMECRPNNFMNKITEEIVDIRRVQYSKLTIGADRKIAPLRGVELLEVNRENNTIVLVAGFIRPDDAEPIRFRVELDANNFNDSDGRVVVERGMVLRAPTFERLFSMLCERKDPIVAVNIQSIR